MMEWQRKCPRCGKKMASAPVKIAYLIHGELQPNRCYHCGLHVHKLQNGMLEVDVGDMDHRDRRIIPTGWLITGRCIWVGREVKGDG